MAEWQLIESAPKDGMPILVYFNNMYDDRQYEVARWEPLSYNCSPDWAAGPECGEHSFRHGVSPTHWMPLPEPPK